MDFKLDTNAAKAADATGGRITETGKYVGVLTRAEAVSSPKGTTGVELSFKADNGASADYLQLWTHKSDGEPLSGYKTVMALLTCLQLRGAKQSKVEVEKYNFDTQQRERVTIEGYPELMNKPVGLLLQKELYTKNNGGEGERMLLVGVFQPGTELTASEILNKATTPEVLSKQLQWLAAKPAKDSRRNVSHSAHQSHAPAAGGMADFDDDIPFRQIGAGASWRAI